MISDENYLSQTLRIIDLKKNYPNRDKATNKEKKEITVVNNLCLSIFKD